MHRVTITIDDALMAQLDAYMAAHGHSNRSEAVRGLVRDTLDRERLAADASGTCIGTLSYVYNHEERELAKRLTQTGHAHHALTVSTLHVHLDHDRCLEVAVLKGEAGDLQHYADHVLTERGVFSGELHLVPTA
ncbi:MAG: nickel-responsive transcriptional regulator NikR [Alphaproteobacteria bacterium]|nr:nickel-responsive transcriptional regulator NikR [Alphaproteobacteria bacterium]